MQPCPPQALGEAPTAGQEPEMEAEPGQPGQPFQQSL